MDSVVIKLRDDFYQQVSAEQASIFPSIKATLPLLTEEELQQLAQVWIDLIVWKQQQAN